MKKVLSLLGLIAILSMLSPVYARGHGEVIHAGPGMHRQMRPHGGMLRLHRRTSTTEALP